MINRIVIEMMIKLLIFDEMFFGRRLSMSGEIRALALKLRSGARK
jgi:hypothetical protein